MREHRGPSQPSRRCSHRRRSRRGTARARAIHQLLAWCAVRVCLRLDRVTGSGSDALGRASDRLDRGHGGGRIAGGAPFSAVTSLAGSHHTRVTQGAIVLVGLVAIALAAGLLMLGLCRRERSGRISTGTLTLPDARAGSRWRWWSPASACSWPSEPRRQAATPGRRALTASRAFRAAATTTGR